MKGGIGQITDDVQCNQFGSRSGTLMVTKPQVPTDTQVSSDAQQPIPLPAKQGRYCLLLSLQWYLQP